MLRSWCVVLSSDQLFGEVDHLHQIFLQFQELSIVCVYGESCFHLVIDGIIRRLEGHT